MAKGMGYDAWEGGVGFSFVRLQERLTL